MSAWVVRREPPAVATTPRPPTYPTAWWGMFLAIITESMLFAGLLSSYFYVEATSDDWPQGGIAAPELGVVGIFSVILLASSVPAGYAERAVRRGDIAGLRWGLAMTFVMGAVFLAYTMREFAISEFGIGENAYASLFHTIVGLHALHLAVGLSMNLGVQAKAWTGRLDSQRHLTVRMYTMYWHFVDAVWVFVFSSLYLSVRWT